LGRRRKGRGAGRGGEGKGGRKEVKKIN